MLQTIFTAVIN